MIVWLFRESDLVSRNLLGPRFPFLLETRPGNVSGKPPTVAHPPSHTLKRTMLLLRGARRGPADRRETGGHPPAGKATKACLGTPAGALGSAPESWHGPPSSHISGGHSPRCPRWVLPPRGSRASPLGLTEGASALGVRSAVDPIPRPFFPSNSRLRHRGRLASRRGQPSGNCNFSLCTHECSYGNTISLDILNHVIGSHTPNELLIDGCEIKARL